METLVMIISILIITLVLLQSAKAEGASQAFGGGGGSELFSNRKERGSELFVTRLTAVLGAIFMIICLIMSL